MINKNKITKTDLRNLAVFFNEYLQDWEEIEDKSLNRTVNKIFNLTNWFNDE